MRAVNDRLIGHGEAHVSAGERQDNSGEHRRIAATLAHVARALAQPDDRAAKRDAVTAMRKLPKALRRLAMLVTAKAAEEDDFYEMTIAATERPFDLDCEVFVHHFSWAPDFWRSRAISKVVSTWAPDRRARLAEWLAGLAKRGAAG